MPAMRIYHIPNEDKLLSAIRQSNGTLFIRAGDNRCLELAPDGEGLSALKDELTRNGSVELYVSDKRDLVRLLGYFTYAKMS